MTVDAPRDPGTARPRRRRWRRMLALLLVLLGTTLLLEVGMRTLDRLRGKPWSPTAVEKELLGARMLNQGFTARAATDWFQNDPDDPVRAMHLHPYFGWEQGPREFLVDAEVDFGRTSGSTETYKLMILGGSVAQMFTMEDYGIAPLREILDADERFHGRPIRVMPFATGGGKQPQQLNRLTYMLALGIVPDAVIVIDGFNEVALGRKNANVGMHPIFPSSGHWAFLASSGVVDRKGLDMMLDVRETQKSIDSACNFALDWHLEQSALLGQMALGSVRGLQRLSGARQEACTRYLTVLSGNVVRGPTFSGDAEEAVGACLRCWTQSSLMIQDICRARSIHYLHVLQPTLHDEGSKRLTPGEIAGGGIDAAWGEGVALGYPRLRKAGEWLRARNVNFLDASMVFKDNGDEIYIDACHFGKRGNRILAEKIAHAFLDSMPKGR